MAAPININVGANAQGIFNEIVRQAKRAQDVISRNPPQIKIKDFGGFKTLVADADNFSKSVSRMSSVVVTFGQTAAFIFGFENAMAALLKTTVGVEKQLTKIKVLLDSTGSEFEAFSKGLFTAAKNTSQSFATAAATAEEFARQGLSVEETLKRTTDALILANTSGISYGEAVKTITVAMAGFRKEVGDTTRVVNILNNVDASFAVSTEDLSSGLQRAGATAKTVGVSFNELIALITSLQQTTQRGGSIIGNSLKSLFTRAERAKSLDIFEGVGVRTTDAEGNLRNIIDILKEYASAENNLGSIQKQRNREQLAGVFQINSLSALLNDLNSTYSVYDQALSKANNTTDEAIRRNEQLNKTLSGLLSQAGTGLTEFASNLGNSAISPALNNILQSANKVLTFLNGAFDKNSDGGDSIGAKLARSVIGGFGNFLSGPGLVLIAGIIQRIGRLVGKGVFDQLRGAFELTKTSEGQLNLQRQISAVISSQDAGIQSILASTRTRAEYENAVLKIIQKQNSSLSAQSSYEAGLARRAISGGYNAVGPNRSGFRLRSFASGYLPIQEEQDSINKGVGGATKKAKPVSIPNFNFGGGKKGNIVANTDEYIVPNFAGSDGSAIFNKEMVKKMGLPSGARKINAAGGYTPNFNALRGYGINARPFNFKADARIQKKFLETEAKRAGLTVDEMLEQKPEVLKALMEEHRIRYPRSKEDLKKSFLSGFNASGYIPNFVGISPRDLEHMKSKGLLDLAQKYGLEPLGIGAESAVFSRKGKSVIKFPAHDSFYSDAKTKVARSRGVNKYFKAIGAPLRGARSRAISLGGKEAVIQQQIGTETLNDVFKNGPRKPIDDTLDALFDFDPFHANNRDIAEKSLKRKTSLPHLDTGSQYNFTLPPQHAERIKELGKTLSGRDLIKAMQKENLHFGAIDLAKGYVPNLVFGGGRARYTRNQFLSPLDNKPRFELTEPTQGFRLGGKTIGEILGKKKNVALSDLIHFPELFNNYPVLADLLIKGVNSKEIRGQFEGIAGLGNIKLNNKLNVEKGYSVLTHETQHAIQSIEGSFPEDDRLYGELNQIKGQLSSKQIKRYQAIPSEIEAIAAQSRLKEDPLSSPYETYLRIKKQLQNKASGYIPNLVGTLLGSGAEGSFYKLRGNVGVKRFKKSNKEEIIKELANTELARNVDLPSYINIPKIIGTPKRSVAANRIGKEIAPGGPLLKEGEGYFGDEFNVPEAVPTFMASSVSELVQKEFFKSGILAPDLHSQNIFLGDKTKQDLLKRFNKSTKQGANLLDTEVDLGGLKKFIKSKLKKHEEKLSVVDLGRMTPFTEDNAIISSLIRKNIASSAALGFIPNLAQFSSSKHKSFPHYKTLRIVGAGGSYLRYYKDKKEDKSIILDYLRSEKKGDANQLYERLSGIAKRGGFKIKSSTLIRQDDRIGQISGVNSNYENFTKIYPQLRYREGRGVTSGNFQDHNLNFSQFSNLEEFKEKINSLPKMDANQLGQSGVSYLTTSFGSGYLPNFASRQPLGKPLGRGTYGTFYDLSKGDKRKGIGVKRFHRLEDEQGNELTQLSPEYVKEELANHVLLSKAGLPEHIGLPKLIGSIKRSYQARRIGKEVISDPTGSDALYAQTAGAVGQSVIQRELRNVGLYDTDVKGANFSIGPKTAQHLRELGDEYEKSGRGSLDRLPEHEFRDIVISALRKNNEKINLLDIGLVEPASPTQMKNLAEIKKQINLESFANGFIPNFASPLKDSVEREIIALSKQGFKKSDIEKSLRVQASDRLKNPENPMGLGVFNTLQGQTNISKALADHRGENLFSAGKHVPNFAPIPAYSPVNANPYSRTTVSGNVLRDTNNISNFHSTSFLITLKKQIERTRQSLIPLAQNSVEAAKQLRTINAANKGLEAAISRRTGEEARAAQASQRITNQVENREKLAAAAAARTQKGKETISRVESIDEKLDRYKSLSPFSKTAAGKISSLKAQKKIQEADLASQAATNPEVAGFLEDRRIDEEARRESRSLKARQLVRARERDKKKRETAKREARRQKISGKVDSGLFGFSFALPLLQAGVSEFAGFKPESKAQKQTDAIFSGAGIGTSAAFLLPNPVAKAAAVTAGVGFGALKALNIDRGASKTFFEADENLQGATDRATLFSRNATAFSSAFAERQALTSDPDAKELDIRSNEDAIQRAIQNIGGNASADLNKILKGKLPNDDKKSEIEKILKNLAGEREREVSSATASKVIKDIQEAQGNPLGKKVIDNVTKEQKTKLKDSVLNSIDLSQIKDKKGLESFAFDNRNLTSKLSEIIPQIQGLDGDLAVVGNALRSEIEKTIAIELLNKKANEELAESVTKLTIAQQNRKKGVDEFGKNISLLSRVGGATNSLENRSKIDLARESLNSPFAKEQDKFLASLDINKAELQSSIQERVQSIKEGGLSSILEKAQGNFGSSKEKETLALVNQLASGELAGGSKSIAALIDGLRNLKTTNPKDEKELSKILDELKILNTTSAKELDNLVKISNLQLINQAKVSAAKYLDVLGSGQNGPLGALNEAIKKSILTAQKTKEEKDRDRKPIGERNFDFKYETEKQASIFGSEFKRSKAELDKFTAKKAIGKQELIDNNALAHAGINTPEFDKIKADIEARKRTEKANISKDAEVVLRGETIKAGQGEISAGLSTITDVAGENIPKQVSKILNILGSGDRKNIDKQLPGLLSELETTGKVRGANIGGEGAGRIQDAISQIIASARETQASLSGPTFDSLLEAKKSIAVGETNKPELDALTSIDKGTKALLQPINSITSSVETFKNQILERMGAAAKVAEASSLLASKEKSIVDAREISSDFNNKSAESEKRRVESQELIRQADRIKLVREKGVGKGIKDYGVESEKALRETALLLETTGRSGGSIISGKKINKILESEGVSKLSGLQESLTKVADLTELPSLFFENGRQISSQRELAKRGEFEKEVKIRETFKEDLEKNASNANAYQNLLSSGVVDFGRNAFNTYANLFTRSQKPQESTPQPYPPVVPVESTTLIKPTPVKKVLPPEVTAEIERKKASGIPEDQKIAQQSLEKKNQEKTQVEILKKQAIEISINGAVGGVAIDLAEIKRIVEQHVQERLASENKSKGQPPPNNVK